MENNKNKEETSTSEQKLGVEDVLNKQSEAIRKEKSNGPARKFFDFSFSWPMIIVLGLGTYGISFALSRTTANLETQNLILFIILSYACALLVYNIGKTIFGYLSGYKISLIEILGLQINMSGDKTKVRYLFRNIAEFHLKMMPKKDKPNPNPTLMFLGGTIFYILVAAVLLIVGSTLSANTMITLYYGVGLGAMIIVYEMLPVKLDTSNDMYLMILSHSPENRETFNKVLTAEALERAGKYIDDFKIKDFGNSRIKPQSLLYTLRSQVYAKEYKAALDTIDKIEYNSLYLTDQDKAETLYEQMYIYLLQGRSKDAERLILRLEKRVKNSSDLFITPSSARTSVLIAGLVDNSLEQVLLKRYDFIKQCRYFGKTDRVMNDIELTRNGISKIKRAHPDWELEQLPENLFEEKITIKDEDDED